MEQTKNAERCAKYRSVNKEKFQLVAAKQQFKRSKELASGTPEAEIFPKHWFIIAVYFYIWQNDRRKAISRKIDQKKEIC